MKGLCLLPIEKVAACYAVLTTLLMAVLWPRLVEPWDMVQMRLWWLLLTAALVAGGTWVNRRKPTADPSLSHLSPARGRGWADLARAGAQLAWLLHWYPDIYEFNRIFPNLDHLFAAADQWLFGCQPSVIFSQWLSGGLWSELFNLGYWSYFPMIATLVVTAWWKESFTNPSPTPTPKTQPSTLRSALATLRSAKNPLPGPAGRLTLQELSTLNPQLSTLYPPPSTLPAIILTSFFIFYLLFLLLPVAGPQFYFNAVGMDQVLAGHFPPVGTWFSSHTDMLPAPGNADGVFYQLVASSQESGERPIAAFPSSHIGLSTIVLLLSRRHVPWLTKYLLPFWFLLCCATVYIQAHYLVDAIAGLLLAPPVLYIATRCVQKI